MGWSVSEDLLCVADDGSVFVYDIHGAIKRTLTMGQVGEIHIPVIIQTFLFTISIWYCLLLVGQIQDFIEGGARYGLSYGGPP